MLWFPPRSDAQLTVPSAHSTRILSWRRLVDEDDALLLQVKNLDRRAFVDFFLDLRKG